MSKLEEALEKAGRLRSPDSEGKKEKPGAGNIVEPIKHVSPHIITIDHPDSPITEEYRRLKSMLIRETKADFQNTIMITSSVDSEGKSLTAINLAVTLAQEIDHTILLIDTDLRKPRIHEYLGISFKYGLSDYLTRDMDLSDVLIKTGAGKMVFLPAGHPVKNPVELLSSGKMKRLIDDIKHKYIDRYVIIDTPPIISCPEGITIGSYVDGILFVVKEGHAKKEIIREALNMLQGFNILGIVFNGVSKVNLDGHYTRNYYSYSSEGRK